ncbi:RsiV family protein [Hymenobacter edaphi]|uniref:DUF3298 domain-containing protein n=1 Tax=Hymenobacter edaphi TaxID=2211146 RepID=A0A328BTQ8_9BACT|nr:RsiV family protein [Hymenobacter edaphi]RAK69911.1 hypothetical protein DLM85_03385 [Hymenobacter edaphi]
MPITRHPLTSSLLLLSLLTACDARRPATGTAAAPAVKSPNPSAAVAADSDAAEPEPSAATARPSPTVRTYLRYAGTVGPTPVVLELTVADSVQGHYYYQRRGGLLTLSAARPAAGQPLTLRETEAGRLTGRWQTQQPLGPTLSGTWLSPDGRRQLPFELREDYTGAVRYTINTYNRRTKPGDCGLDDGQKHSSSEQWDAVYLLPPVSAALAKVQRQFDNRVRAFEACTETEESAWVTYNADFLLSIERFRHTHVYGTPHPTGYYRPTTFDLRTGRLLKLSDLLKPGFELPLRRLLSVRLRTDYIYGEFYQDEIEGDSTQTRWPPGPDGKPLAPLPRNGYYLTPADLGFQYDMYEIAPYVMGPILVELGYREIKPLVRSGSPLAQLLHRGLW